MKYVALLLLSVAVSVYGDGVPKTSDGCGELGCTYNEPTDNKVGNFLPTPDNDICLFRGIPINCNRFLMLPCIFGNTDSSSGRPLLPQSNRGSRVKRQVSGSAAVSATQGFSYPLGPYGGGYPFLGGYGYYG